MTAVQPQVPVPDALEVGTTATTAVRGRSRIPWRFLAGRAAFYLFTLWAAITINFVLPRMMKGGFAGGFFAIFVGIEAYERIGWEEGDVICGLVVVGDDKVATGMMRVSCDAEPDGDKEIAEEEVVEAVSERELVTPSGEPAGPR